MAKNEPAPEPEPESAEPVVSWREQAVTRSLGSARQRAENRVQRYLDAALELMNEGESGKDMTVHQVVERSGQSLRSFYQYFGGKHELLLALFEESVRTTTAMLQEKLGEEDDAYGRLHRFVVEYYRVCRVNPKGESKRAKGAPVMVDFAQQLLTDHLRGIAYEGMSDEDQRLLWLFSALVTVSFPVEVWRQPRVPDSGASSVDVVVEPA